MNNDVMKSLNFVESVVIDNIAFTTIKRSSIHGFGLFADVDFENGKILCLLDGQLMNWDHYEKLRKQIDLGKYQNYIFMEWNALPDKKLLVRAFRTKYSYINHSKYPNVAVFYDPIRIETIKEIKKGDEILIDYSKESLCDDYLNDESKGFLL